MPARRKVLASLAAAAVAATAAVLATVSPAQAAVPTATIPITIKNNSGRAETVYLYNLGTDLASGRQGWADRNGTFRPWPAGGAVPVPAPDASFVGPANGQTLTFRLPKFSGRLYFSFGQKLNFRLATGGLVQPDFANPTDPNINILFDWSEYTLNNDGLWLNSSQVDQFAVPHAVGVKLPNGTTKSTGRLKPGGRNTFFRILREQPGGWGNLIQTRSDGTVLRAVAPGKGIAAGKLSPTILDSYITKAWNAYTGRDLVVTPFANQPGLRYYGRTSGSVMTFRNSSGQVVTSFQKPSSDAVFGCYKELDAPNDLVRGPISRTLCAALNRSTLHSNPNQPDATNANFYKDVVTNHYSRKVHGQMVDGKAYGFAFDDVGAHESLVHDGSPQHAYVTLDPFN
ncbi:glycoside hydrolase family 64 protein [Spirilliplanes yamanashiensis]|uniref:Sugar hydrolase n=1 Tax=Spirilliplanes yamanashiensis TaxID=42233 RepID=A0A8J3Y5W8_9ACTN|nr:glycoside hydrolase family 64 protein [Spirilliplanes yamanashiensis]MDP9819240.1 hypothetical protein [Spirilliplanes yamanashiensis]GIJ01937.1 sugar hydrolase [Spirilliplanes yamanashiensis]